MPGFNQPKIPALKQGKLSGYSIKRLMRFLLVLPPSRAASEGIPVKMAATWRPYARLAAFLPVRFGHRERGQTNSPLFFR